MSTRTAVRITAAVLGGSTLALAVPAYAAVSASSPPAGVAVTALHDAIVLTRGAEVRLSFRVTCPADSTTYLYARAAQRVGGGVAAGDGSAAVACTTVPRRVTIALLAAPGGKAFTPGAAAVVAQLSSYVPDRGNVDLQVDGRVTLSRPRAALEPVSAPAPGTVLLPQVVAPAP